MGRSRKSEGSIDGLVNNYPAVNLHVRGDPNGVLLLLLRLWDQLM